MAPPFSANDIVAPELLLPAQYFGPSPVLAQQPEKRLMRAVLEDAVLTLYKYAGDQRARPRRLVREVCQWIEARNHEWPFSFENICASLSLNAGVLRRGLERIVSSETTDTAARVLLFVGRHVAGERHRVSAPRVHRRTRPLSA